MFAYVYLCSTNIEHWIHILNGFSHTFFPFIVNFDKMYFPENIKWEIEHQLTHTVRSLFSKPINKILALIVSQIIIYFVRWTENGIQYRTPNNLMEKEGEIRSFFFFVDTACAQCIEPKRTQIYYTKFSLWCLSIVCYSCLYLSKHLIKRYKIRTQRDVDFSVTDTFPLIIFHEKCELLFYVQCILNDFMNETASMISKVISFPLFAHQTEKERQIDPKRW